MDLIATGAASEAEVVTTLQSKVEEHVGKQAQSILLDRGGVAMQLICASRWSDDVVALAEEVATAAAARPYPAQGEASTMGGRCRLQGLRNSMGRLAESSAGMRTGGGATACSWTAGRRFLARCATRWPSIRRSGHFLLTLTAPRPSWWASCKPGCTKWAQNASCLIGRCSWHSGGGRRVSTPRCS